MPTTTFEFPDRLDLTKYISAEAHDLRSPFNRILGFTKLVLKGMDGPLTDMQKEDLNTVYSNSAHALSLMNNLVDAARLGLNEKQPNFKEIETSLLVSQGISHWQQSHPSRDVHFEPDISEDVPSIRGDEAMLRQLIAHCLTYVTAYCKDPAAASLQVKASAGEAIFTVSASGEPAVEYMKGELEITGYLCRAILDLHGGAIRQGQTDGTTTVVAFSLPTAGR